MALPNTSLTPLQLQMLRVLATISGLSAGELGVALGRSRSHLAVVLRGLEQRGLLQSSAGRSERGAVTHLYALAPAGWQALNDDQAEHVVLRS